MKTFQSRSAIFTTFFWRQHLIQVLKCVERLLPTFHIVECAPRDFLYSEQWLRAYRVECFFKRKATY